MARRKKNKKTRSRVPDIVPAVEEGLANISEAPGAFRRLFRFSQLSVGTAGGIGSARQIEDIWATFLNEMDILGLDKGSVGRLRDLGATQVLTESGFSKATTAALGTANLAEAKGVLKMARASLKGVESGTLVTKWSELLDDFAKQAEFQTDDGLRIIKELRKVDPKVVAKVGSNQVVSVLARRGEDPFITKMYNQMFSRENTAVLPEEVKTFLKDASKGKLPKVSGATIKALEKGGLATGTGLGRKVLGFAGKGVLGAAGTGIFLGLEANRAIGILGREGRARKLAMEGFEGLGPSSSVDFLRDVVEKQEAVSRRQVVMQQFEPDLMQEVVRILSDTGQSKETLTSTERRIGSDAQIGIHRRGRSQEDVTFLLDQLFSQMGGGGQ